MHIFDFCFIFFYLYFPSGSLDCMEKKAWKSKANKATFQELQDNVKLLKGIKIANDFEMACSAFKDIYLNAVTPEDIYLNAVTPEDIYLNAVTPEDIYLNAVTPEDSPTIIGKGDLRKFGEGFSKTYLDSGVNGANSLAGTWIDVFVPPPSGQQG